MPLPAVDACATASHLTEYRSKPASIGSKGLAALDMLRACGHVLSNGEVRARLPAGQRELDGENMDTMPQNLMMLGNPWQLGLILLVIILLFGKGKVSDLMGDVAKGVKAFKKGMADEEVPASPAPAQPKPLDHQTAKTEAATPANTESGTRA